MHLLLFEGGEVGRRGGGVRRHDAKTTFMPAICFCICRIFLNLSANYIRVSSRGRYYRYVFGNIILNCLCQCQCRYCSVNNINKLSLVGMQLPEKYKENFDVTSEGFWFAVN